MCSAARAARIAVPLVLLLWQQAAAPAAPLQVRTLSLEYPGSEGAMPAHLYLPGGGGRHPGVLVLHTLAGPGPHLEAFAHHLAAEGFAAMTPDLFALHDFGPEGRADHPLVLEDLDGALTFLKAHPAVDSSRIGVVGFSYGGRLAVIAAAAHPDLKAVVVYYAVSSYQMLARTRPVSGRAVGTRPITELAGSVHTPVLIHHGEADRTVPSSQAELLHRALVAATRSSTLYLYPRADHLFDFRITGEGSSTYQAEAARLSWQRTLDFLRQHLGH
jgi:carboxymethylenebutenolidase